MQSASVLTALPNTHPMATLTIRDLDDGLKLSLRVRAARHNRSMEEEARQILRQALQGDVPAPQQDLATRIAARLSAMGGVELTLAPREPARDPPALGATARAPKAARGSR
jgi:plasmid stability protein